MFGLPAGAAEKKKKKKNLPAPTIFLTYYFLFEKIIESSTRSMEFSRHYAVKAHQTQRSGPVFGSLPSLQEVDDLLQTQRRGHDALLRIRNAVLDQEHVLAEQRAHRQAMRTEHPYDEDHIGLYQEEFKGGGGFAGADAKKRRGVGAVS
jgi:hypothetical protein